MRLYERVRIQVAPGSLFSCQVLYCEKWDHQTLNMPLVNVIKSADQAKALLKAEVLFF